MKELFGTPGRLEEMARKSRDMGGIPDAAGRMYRCILEVIGTKKSRRINDYRAVIEIDQCKIRERCTDVRVHLFLVGGKADYLVSPADINEVKLLLKTVKSAGIPFLLIGRGVPICSLKMAA